MRSLISTESSSLVEKSKIVLPAEVEGLAGVHHWTPHKKQSTSRNNIPHQRDRFLRHGPWSFAIFAPGRVQLSASIAADHKPFKG
jgi:hypothetical protein